MTGWAARERKVLEWPIPDVGNVRFRQGRLAMRSAALDGPLFAVARSAFPFEQLR